MIDENELEDMATTDPDAPAEQAPKVVTTLDESVKRNGPPVTQPKQDAVDEPPANEGTEREDEVPPGVIRVPKGDLDALQRQVLDAAVNAPIVLADDEPGTTRLIHIKLIRESPSNPRKLFGDIDAMAASVQKVGIIQDLVVRPLVGGKFEVVVGHRRLRAATKAGFAAVPCQVRKLNDREVLELQLAENIERKTLSVLEESDGLFRLHTDGGVPTAHIAEKVGKSDRWVQSRIQLTKLGPEARDYLEKDANRVSTAILLAAIQSHKLQADAVEDLTTKGADGGEMSYRQAKEYIRETFTTDLRGVAFDRKDDMLVPEAGPCTTCPKRTGNSPELLSEYKRADVCLDVACFRQKMDAHWDAERAKAKAKGFKSLSLQEGKKLFRPGVTALSSDLVDLSAPCPGDKKRRTWREVLGDKATDPELVTIVVAPDLSGNPHMMADKAEALQVAKKAGIKWAGAAADQAEHRKPSSKEDQALRKHEEEMRQQVEQAVVARAVETVEAMPVGVPAHVLRLMCLALSAVFNDDQLLERRNLKDATELQAAIEKMSNPGKLFGLAFEMATSSWVRGGDDYSEELRVLAKVLKVDFNAIEKAVVTAAPAEALFDKKKRKAS